MFASANGKQQNPYCLSGLSRAHFSDNLSRNSCIPLRIHRWTCPEKAKSSVEVRNDTESA